MTIVVKRLHPTSLNWEWVLKNKMGRVIAQSKTEYPQKANAVRTASNVAHEAGFGFEVED